MHTPESPYLFVIDTADYAGNFERELCAYITGCVGDCGVGSGFAGEFEDETRLEPFENVVSEPDEHGCYRPVTIYPSADGKYNSVAISFETRPTAEQVALMRQRAKKFAAEVKNKYVGGSVITKITGFRLLKQKITRKVTEIEI